MMRLLKLILRDPLTHFCCGGVLLFLLYSLVAPPGDDNTVVLVTQQQTTQLSERFRQTWGRAPSAEEMQKLLDDYVLEEIYYREAMAMGIDQHDPVVRGRLRQKLAFIVEDSLQLASPTDKELRDFYREHAAEFKSATRYSFEQIYLNSNRDSQTLASRSDELAAALARGEAVTGDDIGLQRVYQAMSALQVNRAFGEGFSERLNRLTPGVWSEPLRSGLGLHFIYLQQREAGSRLPFEAVREQLESRWLGEKRKQIAAAFNEKLRAKYQVVLQSGEGKDG